jgi:hypothetical protein
MSEDLIDIRLRLLGGRETASGARDVRQEVDRLDSTTASTTATTDTASKSSSRFRSTLSGVGRTLRYAAIPLVGALGYQLVKSISAYREARKVGLQTNAVIKSTGGVANVTADQVAKLSNVLSLKTGVDDEEIQSGANMLLTFKNLRNEVGKGNDIFDQSVGVITDMASALGTDLKSSAIQVGKALNDPNIGLTALSRSGVTFTEEQKEMIKTLFESGHRLKAQKIILKELTSEFGGSARAQHDAVDRLGVAWENLQEVLGKAVYPILQDVTQWLTKALTEAQHGKGPLIDLKNWFLDVGHVIGDVIDVVKTLMTPLRAAYDLYKKLYDLTHQKLIEPVDISGVGSPFTGLAQPDAAPGGTGSLHTQTGGHAQNKIQRAPITGAPKAATGNARRGGSGRGVLRIPLIVNGKTIAEAVIDEAQIAAAWG